MCLFLFCICVYKNLIPMEQLFQRIVYINWKYNFLRKHFGPESVSYKYINSRSMILRYTLNLYNFFTAIVRKKSITLRQSFCVCVCVCAHGWKSSKHLLLLVCYCCVVCWRTFDWKSGFRTLLPSRPKVDSSSFQRTCLGSSTWDFISLFVYPKLYSPPFSLSLPYSFSSFPFS